MTLKRGTQIIFSGNEEIPRAGFVTSSAPDGSFCRLWAATVPNEPLRLEQEKRSMFAGQDQLTTKDTVNQTLVDQMLEKFC